MTVENLHRDDSGNCCLFKYTVKLQTSAMDHVLGLDLSIFSKAFGVFAVYVCIVQIAVI